eukprot:COSAG03_NODE_10172_length_667_cov_0.936620_1_plen_41_part_10
MAQLVGLRDGAVDVTDDDLLRVAPQVQPADHLVPAGFKHLR